MKIINSQVSQKLTYQEGLWDSARFGCSLSQLHSKSCVSMFFLGKNRENF